MRFQLSQLVRWNFLRAHDIVMKVETLRSLTVTAIALRRYQIQNSRLASSLDELVPEFLRSVPVDYMDGRPIRYRPGVNGNFCLYSVGLDGRDDGGDAGPTAPWTRYSSIWDGHDAVWPERGAAEKSLTPSDVLASFQIADVNLSDVINTLARQAQLNLVVDPRINLAAYPTVSLRLANVTAKAVLEAVLVNNNLVKIEHPGTNLVGITGK